MVTSMAQLVEYVKLALMNIRSNKVRTFLTMLGIIIGVSSVILIISVGNGIKAEINGTLSDIAGGQIYIRSVQNSDDNEFIDFTFEDMDVLQEKVEGINGITPVWSTYGDATGSKGTFTAYTYMGNENLENYFKDPMLYGRYFTREEVDDSKAVCVLREQGAVNLFGTADVVGMTFELTLYDQVRDFTIVGVRKNNQSAMYNMMYYMDDVELEMPLTTYYQMLGWDTELRFQGFYIFSDMLADTNKVTTQVLSILEARHNCRGENRIQVEDFNSAMEEVNSVLDMITIFVVFVAGISLLVGGIGVMTIMLVSVTERTREIGIRKALGAKTGSIMFQFLCESAIITLIAGIIGILIGYFGAVGVGKLIGFNAMVSGSTILGASLFSSAVGIFFGIYPARHAAKLSPIEALRHE